MAPTDPAPGEPVGRASWYALGMLWLAYAFNFVDRQILVILQEPIKQEMGISDTELGLLTGFAFALVYITAGIPIARWADRASRRNIVGLAVTVWSGMTALSGLAGSYSQLLLARIGVGIGEAGGSPPAHSMISDYFPPERRATAMSIYSSGLHFGIFAGLLLGGFINDALGWRVAFMAVGAPGLLFAVVFMLTVKEPPRGRWESQAAADYQPTLAETLRLLAGYKSFWYIALGTGLTAFAGYGIGNFAPSFFVRSHGLELSQAGSILASVGGVAGLAGTLLGGRLADAYGRTDKRWYVWVPAIAGCIALPLALPYLLLDNVAIVIFVMFFVTMAINTYLGPCLAICHTLVPPAMRALASAILFFVLNLIGLGLGPLTAGFLSDQLTPIYGPDGLRYALLIVAGISALGIPMFLLAARHLPADLAAGAMATAGHGDGSDSGRD